MSQRKNSALEAPANKGKEITVAQIGLIGAVLVAIVGGIATILSSYFASIAAQAPVLISIQATQTAEARLLVLTLTEIPVASATLSNIPIPTNIATISPSIAASSPPIVTPLATTPPPPSNEAGSTNTPEQVSWIVTTKTGLEAQLYSIRFLRTHAPTNEYTTSSISLKNGMEIKIDYVSRVEFINEAGNFGTVIITLIDGTVMNDNLGWKEDPDVTLYGETSLGSFKTPLKDIKMIVAQGNSNSSKMPQAFPSGLIATVVYTNGESLQVANLKFLAMNTESVGFSMGIPCNNLRYYRLPTLGGFEIDFSRIKEIEFLHEQFIEDKIAGDRLPIKITTPDGNTAEYQIYTSWSGTMVCGMPSWRLGGDVPLGKFEMPINFIKKIVVENVKP